MSNSVNRSEDWQLRALLAEAEKHEQACILLSNGFADAYGKYDIIAGFGAKKTFRNLQEIKSGETIFGFISYDFKNQIEDLESANPRCISVPDLFFFEPQWLYKKMRDGRETGNFVPERIEGAERAQKVTTFGNISWKKPDKTAYLQNIEYIQSRIKEGDFYELNFCTEWSAENIGEWNPYEAFVALNTKAPAPFAAFYKYGNVYLLCSSPERFIQLQGNKIISQPIKGTRKRQQDPHLDAQVKTDLQTSEKDRAENIMITDLVRNDISRFCLPGTVEVAELCGIHSFSHVHQMISTVAGEVAPGTNFEAMVRSTFPMGSMTGAPKVQVMKTIDQLEGFARGWYSGTVGYIDADGFDFNVVIRSLQFDREAAKLAYHVGGAITYDSIPELEYEECLAKAAGILSVFGD